MKQPKVQIKLVTEKDEFGFFTYYVRCYKNNECYFTKTWQDYYTALEYVGWLEAFYNACEVPIKESVV